MNSDERKRFFLEQEDSLLIGGVCYSEWCTFIIKSVSDAFVAGADLATIITAVACIETYFKTENPADKDRSLSYLIDNNLLLTDDEKIQLHKLRKYRNSWVHADRLNDSEILIDDTAICNEAEKMAILSVRMLLTVLFSNQML